MPLTQAELNSARQVIAAAKSSSFDRVYFLGPYARRVSFASQQNRALNLIWALRARNELSAGDPVAVVGAGLSGVTCCAALMELGYPVSLYEAGDQALNRQVAAYHRFIHPTLNRWPDEAIGSTTKVPYFDWVSEICSKLLGDLQGEWKERSSHPGLTFEKNAIVTRFHEAKKVKEVAVETKNSTRLDGSRYKCVIVTSGFDDEGIVASTNLPSYWDPDTLLAEIAKGKIKKFLVSGCGDGGLIDALRFVHPRFEQGELLVRVAQRLSDAGWAGTQKIIDVERDLTGSEGRLKQAIAEGSSELRDLYQDLAESLPPEIASDLELRQTQFFVTIYSREQWPFTPMAAPIHKLLLAHALNRQVIDHQPCEVVSYKKDLLIYVPLGADPKDPAQHVRVKGRVVVRHGAKPNFRSFFAKDADGQAAVEELVLKQKLMADDLDLPMWNAGAGALRAWPPVELTGDDLRRRRNLGAKLVSRLVGPTGFFDWDDASGFLFQHLPERDPPTILPPELFGMPLNVRRYGDQSPIQTKPQGADRLGGSEQGRLVGPGVRIISALTGRLGPILVDKSGVYYALTAGHVVQARHKLGEVYCGTRRIGTVVDVAGPDHDTLPSLGLVRLDRDLPITLGYGRHAVIQALIDPYDAAFGEVHLYNEPDTKVVGEISATRVAVSYQLPDLGRRVVTDAIRIRSKGPSRMFSQPGDSGAPAVDATGALVGLVLSADQHFTYLVRVADFLKLHRLELAKSAPSRKATPARTPAELGEYPGMLAHLARARRLALDEPDLNFGDVPEELSDVE